MEGFQFKERDLVKVDHTFSAAAATCVGQCGTVAAAHALPQVHVRLESGEEKVLHENDLTLVQRLRDGLVEMKRTPVPPMKKKDITKLDQSIRSICA